MERKLIISEQPKCKTCGNLMKEWSPFVEIHEHIECISKRISSSLIKVLKNDLKV